MIQRRTIAAIVFAVGTLHVLNSEADRAKPEIATSAMSQTVSRQDADNSQSANYRRRPTVDDMIQMTRVAGSSYAHSSYTGSLSANFAFYSPNGKHFAIVLKKGNLARNTNDYTLIVFDVAQGLRATRHTNIASFSSSSNREAINQITWLSDNDTILFLGERPGENTQLYSVQYSSRRLSKLTQHPANIVAYSSTPNGAIIVYAAEEPEAGFSSAARRSGLRVSSQSLSALSCGHFSSLNRRLYVLKNGSRAGPLRTRGLFIDDPVELFISPNGRYLIVRTNVTTPPQHWTQYTDSIIQKLVQRSRSDGEPSWLAQFELVDIHSGASRPLLDAPIRNIGSGVVWEKDSDAVVVAGVYLPLNGAEPGDLARRESQVFVAEVKVPSLEITEVSDTDLDLESWDENIPVMKLSRKGSPSGPDAQSECYRKDQGAWKRHACADVASAQSFPEIRIVQDLNLPPRIVAVDPRTHENEMLLDLNPQFRSLDLGKVEEVRWKDARGEEIAGGLYLPPDYVSGRKYPLVIQTHGFDPHQFWFDGPFATAFAAQALAAKGFLVLQVPDSHYLMDTPQEARAMAETYENAIDDLDAKGMVDIRRVGIVGFSRTGLYVRYMLTHGRHHLAAAVIADGFDDGLWAYLAYGNESSYFASELEDIIGARPFGHGLEVWSNTSSGFMLDRVNTPVQIQVNDRDSLLGNWDWFVGLKQLHKPVELIYFPSGAHILEKPSEQLASKQAVIDWFCSWLNGEKAPLSARGH